MSKLKEIYGLGNNRDIFSHFFVLLPDLTIG